MYNIILDYIINLIMFGVRKYIQSKSTAADRFINIRVTGKRNCDTVRLEARRFGLVRRLL